MSQLQQLHRDIKKLADPEKGKFLQRFFKTKEGEYGFGDVFVGLTVPMSRNIANQYKDLLPEEIETLLASFVHEERLIALLILVDQFKKGSDDKKKVVYDFYIKHLQYVNNWDLVDLSAYNIIGNYLLLTRNITFLVRLASSKNIWERRIAIISTFAFIKKGSFKETLKIAEMLIHDKEDLIHKAVGWMLREGGKKVSVELEEVFLKKYYHTMPRTMLRYAIEKFPEEKRQAYLKGRI